MADPKGFLTTPRELPERRPVDVRIQDWKEVYEPFPADHLEKQAGRCMDCGIPFCHQGCPLGNLIPEWNDLVWRDDWRDAAERLHATNNFPEFTGRLCPAPCEAACVLGINADPVTIKQVEVSIIDQAWEHGWVVPEAPDRLTGFRVAVIGSGPAGLAAAQQLARTGHTVSVYERAAKIGGLLRYGIPEFKMEKHHLDRRLAQMEAEGVIFRPGVEVGVDLTIHELRRRDDVILLAIGATTPRGLPVAGADLPGVHQAMDYLPLANQVCEGTSDDTPIDASGKHVVIIGGGDTGADCLGTAHRQGAASVTQLEIMATPPNARPDSAPWPTYPMLYRVTSAHEEGGDRVYSVSTKEFVADDLGNLRALVLVDVQMRDGRFAEVPGTERELPADLVFLAMGFTGPEQGELISKLGLALDERGNVSRDKRYATTTKGVFVAGDAGRGQSLIVWAIAEGRAAAAAIDEHLMGSTNLPAPIPPTARPLVV